MVQINKLNKRLTNIEKIQKKTQKRLLFLEQKQKDDWIEVLEDLEQKQEQKQKDD
jgi:hypothetical protein